MADFSSQAAFATLTRDPNINSFVSTRLISSSVVNLTEH